MENSNFTLFIDWTLRIIQIISFIGVILKISFNNNGYSDNVKIKKIRLEDLDSLNKNYSFIQNFDDIKGDISKEYFVLYPENVDIINLDFIEIKYGKNAKEIEVVRETNKFIKNHSCIIITTILPEGAPHLRIRWKTSNGEIGEHTFHYNGFNGNLDMLAYRYKYTILKKIMCIVGLN